MGLVCTLRMAWTGVRRIPARRRETSRAARPSSPCPRRLVDDDDPYPCAEEPIAQSLKVDRQARLRGAIYVIALASAVAGHGGEGAQEAASPRLEVVRGDVQNGDGSDEIRIEIRLA